MNRFLTKKKNVDAASSPLSPPTSSSKIWKKNKKEVVEEKPQLDLGSALPSIDDFRTSLIMPNLSTRFSMLREQDDPHSLLGKASDDSVLQPQRNSRLQTTTTSMILPRLPRSTALSVHHLLWTELALLRPRRGTAPITTPIQMAVS